MALQEFLTGRRNNGPWLAEPAPVNVGGVDPLGLRQINFNLMDQVFPGLNNVARHIRPFTVVTWAWRRTLELARQRNLRLPLSTHEDFVARVEVAFVWSMLQSNDGGIADVDLPGKQRVASLTAGASRLCFGNETWLEFVKARRHSTALTAAINYGPGLRALHFQYDDIDQPGVRVPRKSVEAALDAFQARIAPILGHKLFNGWDRCTLTRKLAAEWRERWDLEKLTQAERLAMRQRLVGAETDPARRSGFELLVGAAAKLGEGDEAGLRRAMCDFDGDGMGAAALRWKRTQARQAFRLALEALLEWTVLQIEDGSVPTKVLAERLVAKAGGQRQRGAGAWLASLRPDHASPVEAMEGLEATFGDSFGLERAIMSTLALILTGPDELYDMSASGDRLPIRAAVEDLGRTRDASPVDFVGHVLERWVIAQHTYWSVGRGLADARAGAKSILRLRIVLEERGWTVTRGRGSRGMPRPTPDRLRTAIHLAREAGLIGAPGRRARAARSS